MKPSNQLFEAEGKGFANKRRVFYCALFVSRPAMSVIIFDYHDADVSSWPHSYQYNGVSDS